MSSSLNASHEKFLYDQVADLVGGMIDNGTLKPGDRVPSLRGMSRRLNVSVATVMQGYMALERQGLVESRPQSGFYVRHRRRAEARVPKRTRPKIAPRPVRFGDTVESTFSLNHEPGVLPLGIANPAAELMPVKGLTRAMSQVMNRHGSEALTYCFPPGDHDLRRQIAYRSASLGCDAGPDDIVITNGATEALALSLSTVARRGDVIAVESPTYFCVLQLIESLGMLALEICTDPDTGMCLDSLERALSRVDVKAVLTVANFNNPIGSLMPDSNKERLVGMLAERDIPLIEDDIYGDLYFGDHRPRMARYYDRGGRVLTCSSFSKCLAPGYRVGWSMPGRYRKAVTQWKQSLSSATATLPQLAVAEFLRGGSYDRHLKRLRKAYREQVDQMRYSLAEHFPEGTCITRPQGGFVLWLQLPCGVDSREYYQRALAEGVSVTPGELFSPGTKYRNFIRISCGYPWSEDIERAVATLGRIAHRLAGAKSSGRSVNPGTR
jgi:DNA-binding transcriptional MocR family regulator